MIIRLPVSTGRIINGNSFTDHTTGIEIKILELITLSTGKTGASNDAMKENPLLSLVYAGAFGLKP